MRSAATTIDDSVSDPSTPDFYIPQLVRSSPTPAPEPALALPELVNAAISSTYAIAEADSELDLAVDSALFETEGSTLVDVSSQQTQAGNIAPLLADVEQPFSRRRLAWATSGIVSCVLLTWIVLGIWRQPVDVPTARASGPTQEKLGQATPQLRPETGESEPALAPTEPDFEPNSTGMKASAVPQVSPNTPQKKRASTAHKKRPTSAKRRRAARQILADARKQAVAGHHPQAYRLARKSYRMHKTTAALKLMGVSACRNKQRSKASWVMHKLPKRSRSGLKRACARNSIKL